jgi:hypothetical protein
MGNPPVTAIDNGTGYGVLGESQTRIGVEGNIGSPGAILRGPGVTPLQAGVVGQNYASGDGIYGSSVEANGVHGITGSSSSNGVLGETENGTGVRGLSGSGSKLQPATPTGVWGDSENGDGVFGSSANFNGVEGNTSSPNHAGVAGESNNGGTGVYGKSSGGRGNAGHFVGNVLVEGIVTANDVMIGGKSLKQILSALLNIFGQPQVPLPDFAPNFYSTNAYPAPPQPVQVPPQIGQLDGIPSSGGYAFQCSKFTPGATITFTVVSADYSFMQSFSQSNNGAPFQADPNGQLNESGAPYQTFGPIAPQAGQQYFVAATEGQSNPFDFTGQLWSNTVQLNVGP